jgi:hypothetical protein
MKHFALIFTLLLAACGAMESGSSDYSEDGRPEAEFDVSNSMEAGTFGRSGSGAYEGWLHIRGYAETFETAEPFCQKECAIFDYVMFRVLETGNDELQDFLALNEGNAYAQKDAIGIGCAENYAIHYTNQSDSEQMKDFTLPADASNAILNSSEDEPVLLRLTKFPLSGGTEAPACYSHFSGIEIVQ